MSHEPDTLVELTTANDEFEASAVIAYLAPQGIEAKVYSNATATMRLYTSQAIRIDVRRGDLERAAEAVREFRAKPIECNWDEVDTGDRSPLSPSERAARSLCCRACGATLAEPNAERCDHCGASLAEQPPVSAEEARRARETRWDRIMKWWLGTVGGLFLLFVLLLLFGSFFP